jgi:uncharacterized protein (DUF302 family)
MAHLIHPQPIRLYRLEAFLQAIQLRNNAIFQAKGITIFARIDQKIEAEKVGLSLHPTQLLLFGNPQTGTPLMVAEPAIALELPLKALAWEAAALVS